MQEYIEEFSFFIKWIENTIFTSGSSFQNVMKYEWTENIRIFMSA